MFKVEDNTFFETREKAVEQWLDGMSRHDDIEVRSGVKAVTEYIEGLKDQIRVLEEKNALKDEYMKKMRG